MAANVRISGLPAITDAPSTTVVAADVLPVDTTGGTSTRKVSITQLAAAVAATNGVTPDAIDYVPVLTQGVALTIVAPGANTYGKVTKYGKLVIASSRCQITSGGTLNSRLTANYPGGNLPAKNIDYDCIGTYTYFRTGVAFFTGLIISGGQGGGIHYFMVGSGIAGVTDFFGTTPSFAVANGDLLTTNYSYFTT